ncbi:MAG TPA: oligosaccharide flippase family protein [Gaiellaceae bacterium]
MSELRSEETFREERQDEAPATRLGIRALAQDAAIYGGTRVLLKSLAFLLVPLYAHFLAPAQFGVLELVLATVAIVDVFISANVDGVFARFYYDQDRPAWRRQIITLYLLIETVYPAIVIGFLIAFSNPVSERIFSTEQYASFLVIALVDLFLTNIVDLPMILCRVRRKPYTFATYSLIRGLIQIVFSVLLVAVWHYGVKGILVASLISVCVGFVVTLREYVRDLTRHVDLRVGLEMVHFAWPGIIGGLAFYGLNLGDRFILKAYHGLDANGLYGTAFRYSQVVLVGVLAFRLGWTQWHYSWLNTDRHPRMVARGALYFFFGAGFLAVLVSAWIAPLFHVLMPERYWPALPAVAPLAIAGVATGAYSLFTVGLAVSKRMRLIPLLALCGSAVALGFYFLLIPPYSFKGAAWATAIGMWAMALFVYVVSNRIYPVPWHWVRNSLAIGLMVALCLASLAVDRWIPDAPSLPLRLAILLAYPVGLAVLGFFPPGDLGAARHAAGRVLRLRRA